MESSMEDLTRNQIKELLDGMYDKYGYDFRDYNTAHIKRRLTNRMVLSQIKTYEEFKDKVLTEIYFASLLLKDLSIGQALATGNPVTLALNAIKDAKEGYDQGLTIKDFNFADNQKKVAEDPTKTAEKTNGDSKIPDFLGDNNKDKEKSKNKGDKLKDSVDGISGGKVTAMNIHIDSLIKNNTNQITTIKGDADLKPFMEKLQAALITMINDSQIIAG